MDLKKITLDTPLLDLKLFELAGTSVTVATVSLFLLILMATFWISWLIQKAVVRALKLRGISEAGSLAVARRLINYVVMAIGASIALTTVGINLSALFASFAVFAIALGFAMQNIAQNFVSGMILLVERTIKPGDVLEVEGRLIRVRKMGIRATIARTQEDQELIIPNATLVQSTVVNYTLQDTMFRLRTVVGVVYASDMARVRATLEECTRALGWRTVERDPVIQMREFGDNSVNFDVSVWINDPWEAMIRRSDLNEAIWWALQERGIVIAFPQMDVHLDTPVVKALEAAIRSS